MKTAGGGLESRRCLSKWLGVDASIISTWRGSMSTEVTIEQSVCEASGTQLSVKLPQ